MFTRLPIKSRLVAQHSRIVRHARCGDRRNDALMILGIDLTVTCVT